MKVFVIARQGNDFPQVAGGHFKVAAKKIRTIKNGE